MPDQTMFSDVVPLSAEAHGDMCLRMGGGFGFARHMSAVPLVLAELPAAARELPVVFAREGENIRMLALMGLKQGENLFIRADGTWDGHYVPGILRQYPFVVGRVKGADQALLSIDQGYAGFNRAGEGQALFDESGAPSPLVVRTREFAEQLAKSGAQSEHFCKTLTELDLLAPIRITLAGPDGAKRAVDGLQTVNRDRLKALPGEKLASLMASNMLEVIFMHLQSLGNLRPLAARIPKEHGTAELPDVDTPGLK